ncbi:MAG: TolC family protein [Bacteroidales bacterium]|nr:TolC family protein [Bacteroidales bacterium]MDD3663802.1 TolC family protein [Bacteroidales bacterium]
MVRKLVLQILVLMPGWLFSQELISSLSLDQVYASARSAFPGIVQKALLVESHQLAIKNLNAVFYPKSQLIASASYQSDVTSLNINIPILTMPAIPHDSYKAYLDVNQLVYDGGLNSARKEAARVQFQIDDNQVEADFFRIKELLNDLYFMVISGRKAIHQLELGLDILKARMKTAQSAVDNGVMMPTSVEMLRVEISQIQQRISDLNHSVLAAINMISVWIGNPVAADASFAEPDMIPVMFDQENLRPENAIFGLQNQKLELQSRQTATKTLPVLALFGQAGYGRPGLNMLSTDFDGWYLVGVRFQWSPWDWKQTARECKQLSLQKQVVETNKVAYNQRIKSQEASLLAEIDRLKAALKTDEQIIESREKIRFTAVSQFDNGTLDAADMVARSNEETQARINYELHRIQLIQTRIKLNTLFGH